ncbi:hypothetical protein GCM10025868_24100 [Angustibacter aerolatus]|uniref:Uncharacterized protein n=1 Tax=Angustibacter aerolatus TaxID=1162965 RepID=A0ABQ6JK33_9ACTN|nr:hypothetical protein GCM10025868_24100 [Angustibacter aerolatus]
MTVTHVDPIEAAAASPAEARARYRDGLEVPTTGWATGFTQANMVMLPKEWAFDMLLFGQRNPQPVPLLDVTDPGATTTVLAPGADLRTDLPRYRVWRDGELVDEPSDVVDLWRDDLVTFFIGCASLRVGAARRRGAGAQHRAGPQRLDVPHEPRLPLGRAPVGPAGGVDAPGARRARRHRGAGDRPDAAGARCPGARRLARVAGHRRPEPPRLR